MFTKKDLKDGMVVEVIGGERYLVCGKYLISTDGYNCLSDYSDDLLVLDKCREHNDYLFDIIKVYDNVYFINDIYTTQNVIWEREKEYKEMTIAEIEKELGYSIKIVKE